MKALSILMLFYKNHSAVPDAGELDFLQYPIHHTNHHRENIVFVLTFSFFVGFSFAQHFHH